MDSNKRQKGPIEQLLDDAKIKPISLEESEISYCDVCGKPYWFGFGSDQRNRYTVTYSKRNGWRTTRNRKHWPSQCNMTEYIGRVQVQEGGEAEKEEAEREEAD